MALGLEQGNFFHVIFILYFILIFKCAKLKLNSFIYRTFAVTSQSVKLISELKRINISSYNWRAVNIQEDIMQQKRYVSCCTYILRFESFRHLTKCFILLFFCGFCNYSIVYFDYRSRSF